MKNLTKPSLIAKLILALSLLSVLLFIVTPTAFLNYGAGGVHAVWGWDAVFGLNDLTLQLEDTVKTLPTDFNWVLYVTIIANVVLGVTTYLIAPKSKGYYIFAAIIFVVFAIIYFTTLSTWLTLTFAQNASFKGTLGRYLGVGPWFAGLASSVAAIACIVENRMAK